MTNWLKACAVYFHPRIQGIFFLGFSSGLPFLLTLGTLHAWLSEAGISKTSMGIFALATIPYAFKFLWAPIVDHVSVPILTTVLGKRRAWMLTSQLLLIGSLIALGCSNPQENIFWTGFCTFLVALFASNQDNAIEAFRIESLPLIFNGPGASASVSGFRMGMWVSGGGALYLSAFFSWGVVYALMAMCVMVGIFATLVLPEPDHCNDCATTPDGTKLMQTFRQEMANGLYPAIVSFFKKPDWLIVLTFVFLYKIGDTVLNMISIPFLLEIGFSKIEIANVAKTFGIAAMMVGGIIGGISIMRFGIVRNLMVSTAMLVISCLLFMLQARMGSNLELLVFTMGFENLACGISAATLIAYFSSMCNPPNTATMFAILSSFSSMARVSLSVIAGWTADHVSWETFFGLVAIGCTCALVFIWTHATELTGEKFIQRKQGHFPSAR